MKRKVKAKRKATVKTKAKRKFKRVVIVSDLHCGHRAGLTPKRYWQPHSPYYNQQRNMWNWYVAQMQSLGKIDLCISNGDAIDGKGDKSGGTEIFAADRKEQVLIAEECLRETNANEYRFTIGTPYHVGTQEDWEAVLARSFQTKPKGHLQFNVNGITLDIKHKVASSSVPHGRLTPLMKEKLWNTVWADKGGQKNANILVRSHTHFFTYGGDEKSLCVITPGLQGFGSKYGVRQCSGIVTIGFVYFDIYENGEYEFEHRIMNYTLAEESDGTFEPVLVSK